MDFKTLGKEFYSRHRARMNARKAFEGSMCEWSLLSEVEKEPWLNEAKDALELLGAAVSASQDEFRDIANELAEAVLEKTPRMNNLATWPGTITIASAIVEGMKRVSVSASPQPRCPICHATDLTIYTSPSATVRVHCSDDQTHPAFYLDTVADCAKFFAAAPAQEPDTRLLEDCALLLRRCVGKLKRRDKKFADTVTDFLGCKGLTSNLLRESAAQEQPVENSPQPKVLTAAQVLDASDEYCRTKGNPALAPAMRESFRKHREMPRAVLTSLNLKPVVMYETKHPSPQKGKP